MPPRLAVCPRCGIRPAGHPLDRITGHPIGCSIQHGCVCPSVVGDADVLDVAEEMLAAFTREGHPGRRCLRTGWVHVEAVDRWREIVVAARARQQEQDR